MKILLTGATGFLGAAVWRRLMEEGNTVFAVKRSTSDLWRVQDIYLPALCLDADTLSPREMLEQADPDAVVHTACLYGRRGETAAEMVEANILFPLRLLELCAQSNTFFLNIGSLLKPHQNHYSLTKAQFSQWLDYYSDSVPAVTLRFDHLFGRGDDSGKFVGWLVDQLAANVPSIPLTAGEQTRDFIHISDAVDLIRLVLSKRKELKGHSVVSAGSCRETRLRDFVERVARIWEECSGNKVMTELHFGAVPYPHDMAMRTVVPNVSIAGTDWNSRVELDDGIREFVQWRLATTFQS